MKSKPLFPLEVVEQDLEAAIAHYAGWRSDARDHVLSLYDETVKSIAWNPDLFPRKFGRVQRAILRHSYYIVYFLQEQQRSVVLAVLDGRRNPAELKRLVGIRRRNAQP